VASAVEIAAAVGTYAAAVAAVGIQAAVCSARMPTVRRLGVCSGADKSRGAPAVAPGKGIRPAFQRFRR
jgi:hypothetical protein